ncbi:putative phage related protein [Trichonephila clavata]|uniref:Putative phage related protein n=1 Tax=Trichonephila clavata TaxID=2740835 RepID=A0A8X6GR49_TRICU|nr:putative phage related protein [Trichonephila clavata]
MCLAVHHYERSEKENMVEPGSLPFLFGVLGRGNNYYGHGIFTTELGQWSSDITKNRLYAATTVRTFSQKSKSYEIQAKAAENILADQDEKDTEIIEPLAKVRGISIVQMAELIQEKVKRAKEAIIKCEELEDLAKKKIRKPK